MRDLAGIRDDQVPVDADGASEAAAGLAGPQRGVEGEAVGAGVAVTDVAVRAVQVRREAPGGRRGPIRARGDGPGPGRDRAPGPSPGPRSRGCDPRGSGAGGPGSR